MEKVFLEGLKERIENEVDGYSIDFVNEHSATDNDYIDDDMRDFADNNTSIYYSDQRAYYNEHSSECDDALLELYDADSIAQEIKDNGLDYLICKAGALGEYEAIYRALYDDKENILTLIAINYLLDNFDEWEEVFTDEEVDDLLSEVECMDCDRFNEIGDLIDEKVEAWKEAQEEAEEDNN